MLKGFFNFRRQISITLDILVVVVSFVIAYFIRSFILKFVPFGESIELGNHWELIVVITFLWWWIFSLQGAYALDRFTSLSQETKTVLKTVFFGTVILLSGAFLLKIYFPARTLIVIFAGVNFSLLVLEKTVIYYVVSDLKKRGYHKKPVIIVGTGEKAREFMESIKGDPGEELEIVGFIGEKEMNVGNRIYGCNILGNFSQLKEVLHRHPIDEIIFALSKENLEIGEMLRLCEEEGVTSSIITDFPVSAKTNVQLRMAHNLPLLTLSRVPYSPWQLFLKRITDIIISALASAILSPLFLIIAALVKFTSPGPVFYQWEVVGFNKRPFNSWKFRTMVENADELKTKLWNKNEMLGPVFKIRDDPRITRVGRILRRFSLDELPQLYSVLRGDMSLVGPRPPLIGEVDRFESWQRRKLSLKPGLTCLWQVSGRNEIRDFDDWAKLDLEYIDNWSLWLDVKIFFKTVYVVLSGSGR
ncbi:MAG TPA: sugar transferase [Candidatus Scalindua sp.]|nr:sugar transferase [Candidatus Scalindua sp.]